MIKKDELTNRTSIVTLRLTLFGLAVVAGIIAVLLLPTIYTGWASEFPEAPNLRYPLLIGLSIAAGAFWTALYQASRILTFIDRDEAFAERTIRALNVIKWCAFTVCAAFVVNLPAAYHIADSDDAPGVMVIALAFTGAPFVVGVFAAVMQRLLSNVISIKSENDLTV